MGIYYFIFVVLLILNYSSTASLQKNSLAFEILEDHNILKQKDVIKYIWEREPSSYCNIVKPSEKSLLDNKLVQFNFVPVLCMILYDASLRYMRLNTTFLENTNHNLSQIINQSSPHTFCQQMEENTWFTTIDENKRWVSNFDKMLKRGNLCSRYCVSEIVNPLCSLALWLDLSVKNGEHKLAEISQLEKQGNSKTQARLVTNTSKQSHSPAAVKKTDGALASLNKDEDPAQKIDNKVLNLNKSVPRLNVNPSGVNIDDIPNLPNGGMPSKAQNIENLSRAHPKKPSATIDNGNTKQLHIENSNGNSEKSVIKNSSRKTEFVSGQDIVMPEEKMGPVLPQSPIDGISATKLSKNVSMVSEEGPYEAAKVESPVQIASSQIHQELKDPDKEGKIVGGSAQSQEGQTGPQKATNNSSPVVKLKPSAPESVPIPGVEEISHQTRENVNTTDTVVKEKTKPKDSKIPLPSEGVSKLPRPSVQIGRSEIDEANTANEPEFDGEPPFDPDDNEEQKKIDDGVLGSQGEERNHVGGLGGINSPQDNEDFMDTQDVATEESRFDDGGSLPKPEPSAKVAADYGGNSDEDDDTMLGPDGRVTQNDAGAGFPRDRFIDAEDSHFFAYFMTMIILCILGYLIFHNKQKILALALEGRVRKGSRRRPSTSGYRKLDSNLEEAVTSNCTGSSVTHVIY